MEDKRVLLEKWPKLRRDVAFLPTQDGILFRNDKALFSIKGASSYPFISKLLRLFDGRHKLGDVCESLDATRSERVLSLVESLSARGVLSFVIPENEALLPAPVQDHFRRQMELIEHFTDRPLARFKDYRETRVLLMGGGLPASAAAVSLVRNGLRELHVVSKEEDLDLGPVRAEVASLTAAGVEARVQSVPASARVEDYDVVAYCSNYPSLRLLMDLNERCLGAGKVFLAGVSLGDSSYLGPLVVPAASACWACSFLRIAANALPEQSVELWRSLGLNRPAPAGPFVDYAPAAQMLGNNLAFELFKYRCGHLLPETHGGVLVQSLETLEASRVPLAVYPECPHCAARAVAPMDPELVLQHKPETRPLALIRAWRSLVHPRMGVIQAIAEEDILQVPFRCASATFASPRGGRPPVTVYGFDPVQTSAAIQAALIETGRRYSLLCPPSSNGHKATYRELLREGAAPVEADHLMNWPRAALWNHDERISWAPAYSVAANKVQLVPAEAAYQTQGSSFHRPGSGAGDSLRAALEAAIENALAWERVTSFTSGAGKVVRHAEEDIAALDRDLEFLISTIRRFDRGVRIFELCGSTPVRVVLALPGGPVAHADACAIGVALSLGTAVRRSLTSLGGAWQLAGKPGDFGYSIVDVAPAFQLEWLEHAEPAPKAAYAADSPAPLLDALLQSGFDALFADITPLDIRASGSLFSGVALLRRAQARPEARVERQEGETVLRAQVVAQGS